MGNSLSFIYDKRTWKILITDQEYSASTLQNACDTVVIILYLCLYLYFFTQMMVFYKSSKEFKAKIFFLRLFDAQISVRYCQIHTASDFKLKDKSVKSWNTQNVLLMKCFLSCEPSQLEHSVMVPLHETSWTIKFSAPNNEDKLACAFSKQCLMQA